jgi:hypothetical protein
VDEGGPHVQALALGAVDHNGAAGVDQQTQGRDRGQTGALDGHRVAQTGRALEQDPRPGCKQQQGADLGGHHLGAGEPEAVPGADRARCEDQGPYRDTQAGDVGDQVGGVGEQRQ